MLLQLDPEQPEPWLLVRAVELIRSGGVVVVPTDTVYGLACLLSARQAVKRIYQLKNLNPKKHLALLVGDLGAIATYARGVTTPYYRMLKRVLPGPYTFIFEATKQTPKSMLHKRKTIGIRMPNNPILLALLDSLDEPLMTTSIRTRDEGFVNDPGDIEQEYRGTVDLVIDGGVLLPHPSTVVDLSGSDPVLLRRGKGDVDALQLF